MADEVEKEEVKYTQYLYMDVETSKMLFEIQTPIQRDLAFVIKQLVLCAHEAIIKENAEGIKDPDPQERRYYKERQAEAYEAFWLEGVNSRL